MASSTVPWMRAIYSRFTSYEGCIKRLASSPWLVNSRSPLVLMSRRPIAIQRPLLRLGKRSKTVGRPSGSDVVHTSPSGLLYMSTRGVSSVTILTGRPSTRIRSSDSARSPSLATEPLTETRPAEIHFSSSRRDPNPAVASTFCSFSLMVGAAL